MAFTVMSLRGDLNAQMHFNRKNQARVCLGGIQRNCVHHLVDLMKNVQ